MQRRGTRPAFLHQTSDSKHQQSISGDDAYRALDTTERPLGADAGGGELRHVGVKQLVEDFGQYTYLPRLRDGSVLTAAIEDGVNTTAWEIDGFALADGWDEEKKRYRGLKAGRAVSVTVNDDALVVRPEVARAQMDAEQPEVPPGGPQRPPGPGLKPWPPGGPQVPPEPPEGPEAPPRKITRFHGTVPVDPLRAGRDAGRIANEVIKHLSGLVGAKVEITLEVQAEVPEGIPEDRQRILNENCRTLKFQSFGFEEEQVSQRKHRSVPRAIWIMGSQSKTRQFK